MTEQSDLPEGQESFKLNEVCKMANVQPYMLRFWGQEFPKLEAGKSGTGQRLFRRDQVELILEIKRLLFDEGLTIAGARKRLDNAEGGGKPGAVPQAGAKGEEEGAKATKRPKTRKRASSEPVDAGIEEQKVDKEPVENVQTLLATLRGVRKELAEVVVELKID